MPAEMPSIEHICQENRPQNPELFPEQKIKLGKLWTNLIVDNATVPVTMGEMGQNGIEQWLFGSLTL